MQRRSFLAASGALTLATAAGFNANAIMPVSNPLLLPWTGPYGGLPPFDKVKVADFKPAIEEGMAWNLAEIDRIANNPEPATFENTIAAMEGAGRPLGRAMAIYGIWKSTMNLPDMQAVATEMEPKLSAFNDQIIQNEKLFHRIEAVYNSPAKAKLTPEQQRLVWVDYTDFVRAGAKLNAAQKARLSEINQKLAGLYTTFSQNLQADEDYITLIDDEADLAGVTPSLRDSFAQAAEEKGHKGKWAVVNTRSSMDPFLTYAQNRSLREKVWRTYYSRCDNNDAHDNKVLIGQVLTLRAERAKLLGYPTHAHWRVENVMAKTPDNAMDLMMKVWPAAVARVHEEVADMQAVADKEGAGIKIAPWDYRFYAEKVRKAKYDLDAEEIKPYMQLEKLRDGVFWASGQLYGFQYVPRPDIVTYHPDMKVLEVKAADGSHVGVWYWDPYARPGKDSGAWMNEYRSQEKFEKPVTPIVSNNSNFVKGKPGEAVLISWDDGITMFHEFGHALHGLNSNVHYPQLAGTNTARDFVEFPSQLNENWLSTPEVLNRFAVHYQTGAPMPPELVAKIKKAATFNQGFATVEYLAGALYDMKIHLADASANIDPDVFEKTVMAELGMPAEVVMRHRPTQFAHIFSSDEYSAGYYSYLWSEVLDHDAFEAFQEAGGPYDKAMARKLHDTIMSVGNTVDPAQAYRNFRGRDPKVEALMRFRGFPVA